MVKFSKQLEVQLVPEWKTAFCDYWQLKKDIKHIRLQHKTTSNSKNASSLIRSFSRKASGHWIRGDVIFIHQRRSVTEQEEIYETEPLGPISQAELEKLFFARLDSQLNKVNQFYRDKEQEYLERKEALIKQLTNLIEMRETLKESHRTGSGHQKSSEEDVSLNETKRIFEPSSSSEDVNVLGTDDGIVAGISNNTGNKTQINEQSVGGGNLLTPKSYDSANVGGVHYSNSTSKGNQSQLKIRNATPLLTISALSQMLKADVRMQQQGRGRILRVDSRVRRKQLRYAEKMLRAAFIEFYRGLGLLRSFSSLNMVAFAKILKKYDKVTGRQASLTYLKVVERAYFYSSDKVVKMMDEIEKVFTNHFASADHKKAMTFLRPIQQRASHTVTFFLGLFAGCSIALLAAFIILLHIFGVTKSRVGDNGIYLDSVYPVFSMLALIILHMYMYGWNLYTWRCVRINYAFIFEFAPKTEMRHREVFLLCTGLTALLMGGLLAYVTACTRAHYSHNIDVIPLALVLIFLLILFCPFNIMYRSSRFFFLRSLKHIMFSPFYKVVMADFFLADQLTSQVPMLKNAEYVMCYYLGAHFRNYHRDACYRNKFHYADFAYVISLLPYWWRLMQCSRRWMNENDRVHIANGGKYLSAMAAAAARLTYLNNQSSTWLVIFIITSTMSTIYQLYWDLVIDWGLLQPKSKNPWLRDELMLETKCIYFFSMALNSILRFAWLQSITQLHLSNLDTQVADLIFASLEVIRRGHWNFYRLENEHLNNVGKFRAVKTVPLPFVEMDESEV